MMLGKAQFELQKFVDTYVSSLWSSAVAKGDTVAII
jgi:hypothetical protein